jgi:hypothetical protein
MHACMLMENREDVEKAGDIESEYRSHVTRKGTGGKKECAFVFVQSSHAFSTFHGCLPRHVQNRRTIKP